MSSMFEANAAIKLVIWDLDDTFWSGTLSEEGIVLSEENIRIVKTLVDRGIMSSIVSKNDLEPVKKVLGEAGLWDYFIFPKISWNPKGSQIAEILEQANLRPDNTLFIDDNTMNVEEARHRFPTMMVAYPQDVLPQLLDLKQAAGKDDRVHSRLNQYKALEQKVVDQEQSALSNVEFLRGCDIKVQFEFDVEEHMNRIIELINRSNQLNYTKLRIESEAEIEEFKQMLRRHDIVAAGISASDRYGTHGLIGFYMQAKNERVNRLIHYVWSCRMMNAGLEQYVYERLGCPEIEVVAPVSNPIVVFERVDWITEAKPDQQGQADQDPRLLLIGSCDLTAVASYCSANRLEFVNGVTQGVMTRYDDFGFILGDRDTIVRSRSLKQFPAWSADDFVAFHEGLASSDVLVVSLSAAMKGSHCVTSDGVVLRVHPEGLGHHIDFDPGAAFLNQCSFYENTLADKIEFLRRSLTLIDASAPPMSRKFLLGANTRDDARQISSEDRKILESYNENCLDFCNKNPRWQFVSINEIVPVSQLVDDRHYTRIGYYEISKHINARLAEPEPVVTNEGQVPSPATEGITSLVRRGRRISRFHTFGGGRQVGSLSYLKQAIKFTPFSRILRKMLRGRSAAA